MKSKIEATEYTSDKYVIQKDLNSWFVFKKRPEFSDLAYDNAFNNLKDAFKYVEATFEQLSFDFGEDDDDSAI